MKNFLYAFDKLFIPKSILQSNIDEKYKKTIRSNIRYYFVFFILMSIFAFYLIIINYYTNPDDKLSKASKLLDRYYNQESLQERMEEILGGKYDPNSSDVKSDYIYQLIINDLNINEKNLLNIDDEQDWTRYNSFYNSNVGKAYTKNSKFISEDYEYKALDDTTYYAKFKNFYGKKTYNTFKKHINEMKNHSNLIIDLRDNGGGVVDEAIQVSDLFLEKNVLLYEEQTFKGIEKKYTQKDKVLSFEKIVILTNEGTASASELLIYMLKKNLNNITVVGTNTFGKSISCLLVKNDDYTMYSIISGQLIDENNNYHSVGITPDIIIKDNNKQLDTAKEICTRRNEHDI